MTWLLLMLGNLTFVTVHTNFWKGDRIVKASVKRPEERLSETYRVAIGPHKMSVSRTISYQALRSTYQPSSCYLATRNRHYSASAAAEQPSEEAGPSSGGLSSHQSASTSPPSAGVQSTRKAKSFRPISNKNRVAYERAKSNAEALRKSILQGDASKVTPENSLSGPVASTSALTPSKPKVEQSPTLETLESYRPERPPNPFGQRYKARYDKVWWAVSTAFLRKQLLKLAREIGFKGSNRVTTKDSLVEYILRTWDWPPVAEVEAEKKAMEEARKPVERGKSSVGPMSYCQLFYCHTWRCLFFCASLHVS